MPVVHCKKARYDVYIGRPSMWGNPYTHLTRGLAPRHVETREKAIVEYRRYLHAQLDSGKISLQALADLAGKTLGCWCSPLPCHGEVLLQEAEWAKDKLAALAKST
jgi:hypothetical protein